jgi:hypothetical protein
MTFRQPPSYLQNASLPAVNDRLLLGTFVRSEGVLSPTHLAASAASSGTDTVLTAGGVFVKNDLDTVGGYYWTYNDASYNVHHAASNPTSPRIDTIAVRVRDTEYSGLNNDSDAIVVTGTPAASPLAPALPAGSSYYPLYDVRIPQGSTAATQYTYTDRRVVARLRGDVVPIATQTLLSTLDAYPGLTAIALDTGKLWMFSGTTWTRIIGANDDISYTDPVPSLQASSPYVTVPITVDHWHVHSLVGNIVLVNGVFTVNSAVNGGQAAYFNAGIPTPAGPGGTIIDGVWTQGAHFTLIKRAGDLALVFGDDAGLIVPSVGFASGAVFTVQLMYGV